MRLAVIAIIISIAFGCAKPSTHHNMRHHVSHDRIEIPGANGKLRFATLRDFEATSLLKDFHAIYNQKKKKKKSGRIRFPVCFESLKKIRKKQKSKLKRLVRKSFNKWIAPLRNYNGWKVKNIRLRASFRRKCTPRSESDKKMIFVINNDEGRSYSEFWLYKATIRKNINTYSYIENLFLHEIGHQMGLADTYQQETVKPMLQPESIMNLLFNIPTQLLVLLENPY